MKQTARTTKIYKILLKQKRLEYERTQFIERNSLQITLLLFLNILILFYINYSMKSFDISIVISYKLFYIIIFSLIFIIVCIYDIRQKDIIIDIILCIKIFLFFNIILLICCLKYILYLHNTSPYINLIKIFDLIEIKHKITFEEAIEFSKEYCSKFGLEMIKVDDLTTICNITTDFNIIEKNLHIYNQYLLDLEKEELQKYGLYYNLEKIVFSYIPRIINSFLLLGSHAHTPAICFNILDWLKIILLQENFPKEIFEPDVIFDDEVNKYVFELLFPDEYKLRDFLIHLI